MKHLSLLICLGILALAGPARGQAEPPPQYGERPAHPAYAVRGYVGLAGVGTGVLGQSGGAEYIGTRGGGFSLYGGVRLGPMFALELNYTGSFHNPQSTCSGDGSLAYCSASYLGLHMLSVDARVYFPTWTRFDPYVQGGLMGAWVGRQGFAPDAKGGGFDLGGGVDFWLGNNWTLGARGLWRGVKLSDYATYTGTDEFVNIATFEVSLAAHF
jgi:opacity protein-like surface antigen